MCTSMSANKLSWLLSFTNAAIHDIILSDHTPITQKKRKIPVAKKAEVKKLLDEMLKAGIISRSNSPWVSSPRLVAKEDGTIRMTMDYVHVNNVTLKDAYPLPNIQELFTQFKTAKYITKLDLSQGHFQVPINTKSKPLTAFICEFG